MFTSGLLALRDRCDPAGPLRHVAGFPDLGLLRVLRPIPAASVGDVPSHRPAGCWSERGPPGWFPRSLLNRLTGEVPNYAPAASPRLRRSPSSWPPDRRHHPAEEFSVHSHRCAPPPSPYPPDWSWWTSLERRLTLVPHVHLPVLLAGPGPSGSTGSSRLCQGCLPPRPSVPTGRAALSFFRLLRQPQGGVLSSPHGSRAPRGARCQRSTARRSRRDGTHGSPGPSGKVAAGSGLVVTLKRRGLTPTMPRLAMRAATVLWLTRSPASCRSRVIRGAP